MKMLLFVVVGLLAAQATLGSYSSESLYDDSQTEFSGEMETFMTSASIAEDNKVSRLLALGEGFWLNQASGNWTSWFASLREDAKYVTVSLEPLIGYARITSAMSAVGGPNFGASPLGVLEITYAECFISKRKPLGPDERFWPEEEPNRVVHCWANKTITNTYTNERVSADAQVVIYFDRFEKMYYVREKVPWRFVQQSIFQEEKTNDGYYLCSYAELMCDGIPMEWGIDPVTGANATCVQRFNSLPPESPTTLTLFRGATKNCMSIGARNLRYVNPALRSEFCTAITANPSAFVRSLRVGCIDGL